MAKVLPSLAKTIQLIGSLARLRKGVTGFGGFGDDLSVFGIVDNEDVGDGYKEEIAFGIEGAAVDDVGVGRFGFGLGKEKGTIC